MNEFIPREVARANRLGAGLTFLTIDVDKFRSHKHQVWFARR